MRHIGPEPGAARVVITLKHLAAKLAETMPLSRYSRQIVENSGLFKPAAAQQEIRMLY
jgi:hypothetical protein